MVGTCSTWVSWDTSRPVFSTGILKSDNSEGFSPERGVNADKGERSYLSAGCCGDRQHPTVKTVWYRGGKLWGTSQRQFLPPLTSAWLCCCCLPSSFFSSLPDSLPLFYSAQVPLLFLVGLSSPHSFSLHNSFLYLFLLISPHFLAWTHLGEVPPRHNYRLIFRCFFFLLRHWEQGSVPSTVQPWQYYYQVLYFKTPRFALTRKPCYVSASSQLCLLVPPSTSSFGTQFSCSKEFWFFVAPKIPFLWFNKGTGHIWSFWYISV